MSYRAALAAATALVLIGCSRVRERAPGTAVVLLESAPESLDPRFALSVNAQRVGSLLFPGLVRVSDSGEAVPDLAESFHQLSPTEWIFRLRRGLTFHDGNPLRASDVAFTFATLKDPSFGSPLGAKFEKIRRVEAVDELEVVVELTEPFAPILLDLGVGIVPEHLATLAARDDFARAPVGAGAFRFVSRPDEEHLTLAAFAEYYGGRPAIEQLSIVVVRDETTRVLSLLHGDADLLINAVSPVLLPRLERAPHLHVQTRPGAGYAYLGFNLRHAILRDVRVRRAFALAISRDAIARFKFQGAAHGATGMLSEEHWAYTGAAIWPHDPQAAKRLLDDAGYPDPDGDGPLRRFTISYKTSTDRFRKAIALVIASELEKVGIGVDVRAYEWGTFFGDVKRGRFEVITLKWTPVIEPHLYHWAFHSASVPSDQNQWVGGNRGGYINSEVDSLIDDAARSSDPLTRCANYARVQQILGDELPYVSLWHEDTIAVVSNRLRGFLVSPFGFFHPLISTRAL